MPHTLNRWPCCGVVNNAFRGDWVCLTAVACSSTLILAVWTGWGWHLRWAWTKWGVNDCVSIFNWKFRSFIKQKLRHVTLPSIESNLNQPGETGPPELLSKERPESDSKSSRTRGSMLSKHSIRLLSIESRPSKPSWLIWSNTASSRQPPSALFDDTFPVMLHTEAKGSAARPRAIPGEASEFKELVDSIRKKALCCWVVVLGSVLSDANPNTPGLVSIASCRLTFRLMALVMSVSRSDRRSVTRGSKSYILERPISRTLFSKTLKIL